MIWAAAIFVGIATPVPVHAQDAYPSRPIKLIVPFTPGTGIDILARTLGQKIGEDWKTASSSTTAPAPAATSAPRRSRRPLPTDTRC
jgi:tripartite-type tricarboxylate transporter receptor subunit TctC